MTFNPAGPQPNPCKFFRRPSRYRLTAKNKDVGEWLYYVKVSHFIGLVTSKVPAS